MLNLRDILANNMRENRRKRGISQAILAEKAGISTQFIAMIELSKQFPSPEVLERIAVVFGIEAYELFTVPPSPESTIERLHSDVIKEIREVINELLKEVFPKGQKE